VGSVWCFFSIQQISFFYVPLRLRIIAIGCVSQGFGAQFVSGELTSYGNSVPVFLTLKTPVDPCSYGKSC
jgi:hypothetical protein